MNAITKLQSQPVGYLTGRGLQRLRASLERWGWPTGSGLPDAGELGGGCPPDPAAWLADFRSGAWPYPFASLEAPSATARIARERWPRETTAAIRKAGRILAGRFDILGHRNLSFGRPVDWHLEPVVGRRAPRDHWSRVPYMNPEVVGDPKVTWELNRHQWLVTLGRAYRMTEDERFAEAFTQHLGSWMDANPPKFGINWASSLEVALRAIAWIWALHLFRDSPRLTPAFFLRVLRYLVVHARHVEAYLSTWFSPNTHLTGEALGLLYMGTLLPRLPGAAEWQRTGLRVLVSELDRQVLPDGVYFEHATWYHRYTADFYLHLLILSRRHALGVGDTVREPLERVVDHLMWLVRPDGSAPRVGDDDGGRLLFLDGRSACDFRSTLVTGATLYGRDDWAYVAGEATEETLWLLGREGLQSYDALDPQPPRCTGRAFPNGGFYAMRDGWARKSSYLLIRCGSPETLAGHSHADALSFDLTMHGMPILVDPGTCSYSDPKLRNRFRGTSAHNTLTLGNIPSATPGDTPFAWKRLPSCRAEAWQSTPRFAFFEGRHEGFRLQRLRRCHMRSVLFLKGDYWVFRDRVEGEAPEPLTLNLQFATGARVHAVEGGLEAVLEAEDGSELLLRFACFGTQSVRVREAEVSPLYGALRPAPAASLVAPPGRDREMVTFVLPGEGQIQVESDGPEGHVWRLRQTEESDTLAMLGDSGTTVVDGLASDFEWVWARREKDSGALREAVLISGTWLAVEGQEVVRAEAKIPWLVIRMGAGPNYVEAPSGVSFWLRLPGPGPTLLNGSPVASQGGGRVTVRGKAP